MSGTAHSTELYQYSQPGSGRQQASWATNSVSLTVHYSKHRWWLQLWSCL